MPKKVNYQRPSNGKGTFKRMFSYLKPYRGRLIVAVLLILLSVGANVGATLLVKPLIAGLAGTGTPTLWGFTFESKVDYLFKMVILLVAVYSVGVVAGFFINKIFIYLTANTLYSVRVELFNKMQRLPIRFFDTHTHGELMSRLTNDIDVMNDFYARSLPNVLQSALQVLGVFASMIALSWQLTLVVVVMLVVMLLVTKFFGKKAKTNFLHQQTAVGELNGFVEEMVGGQKVVKVFNHEQKAIERFGDINERLRQKATRANSYANMMMPIMGNVTQLFYILIAVVGTLICTTQPQEIIAAFLGTIASFLLLLRQFSMPISQVSQQVNVIFMALAGAERIFDVIDSPAETDDGKVRLVNVERGDDGSLVETDERTGLWAWKHPHETGETTLTELKGDVRLENVTFGYVEDKIVLDDVSLYAKPGQKIAFVGSTGAGKTTITNLLTRFYDVPDGKIRYDGININKIKKDDLRRSLGMVLQDTHLFTGTVMENIRYGKLDATDEQCIAAAKTANAHFFISHLPQGYDTMLTGDGANLSQGQRQLIAIARAAVADPPVLILDEATSSIDTRTEWLIEKGMDALMAGRTTFVIAHRLSTVRNADAIMVLEHGKIIERGSHDDLIAQKGKYYELYTGMFELS